MEYTTIEKIVTIRGRGCRRPWQPQAIQIDGADFIKLHLRDKFLMRYITGQTFATTPEGEPIDLVCEWWNIFRGMRNDACIDAVHGQPDGEDVFEAEASKSAKRLRRADVADAPRSVTISLPEFEALDGTTVPSRDMKVAFEALSHACVSVEATADNMEYVRSAVLRSIEGDTPCRRRRRGDDRVHTGVKGTYYNYDRGSVYCRYLNKSGERSYCEFAVGAHDNATCAEFNEIVKKVATRLHNHVQGELVDEGADDTEDVACELVVVDAGAA
jgi:hypothetical protein